MEILLTVCIHVTDSEASRLCCGINVTRERKKILSTVKMADMVNNVLDDHFMNNDEIEIDCVWGS